ncbi:MAG: phosphoenolpyruvate carboxykinase domain-containing protein, partial [Candidatus Omnitrophica bacterium]|nr:phosphoenolpyruvate carboxykinase domain-containing protein [Candidatus Omnitrophota bacterium]
IYDIDMTGISLQEEAMARLLEVNRHDWQEELKGVRSFFLQFKKDLPEELWQEYEELHARLKSNE